MESMECQPECGFKWKYMTWKQYKTTVFASNMSQTHTFSFCTKTQTTLLLFSLPFYFYIQSFFFFQGYCFSTYHNAPLFLSFFLFFKLDSLVAGFFAEFRPLMNFVEKSHRKLFCSLFKKSRTCTEFSENETRKNILLFLQINQKKSVLK